MMPPLLAMKGGCWFPAFGCDRGRSRHGPSVAKPHWWRHEARFYSAAFGCIGRTGSVPGGVPSAAEPIRLLSSTGSRGSA